MVIFLTGVIGTNKDKAAYVHHRHGKSFPAS
jgi:hypothetical protein